MGLPIKNPLNSLGLTTEPGSLKAFYNKICSNTTLSQDLYPYYINVPKWFDVSIKNITPSVVTKTNKDDEDKSLLSSLKDKASNMFDSLVDSFLPAQQNSTAFMNGLLERAKQKSDHSMIHGVSEYLGIDLNSDFKYFVQSITLPNSKIDVDYVNNTMYDEPVIREGSWIKCENNIFTLNILDTAAPLHEYLFYPWMVEAAAPVWTYASRPFTKADIYINFMFPNYTQAAEGEGNMIGNAISKFMPDSLADDPLSRPSFTYIFKNCYPVTIDLIQPKQQIDDSAFTRAVTFTFSHALIQTSYVTKVSVVNKLLNSAASRVLNPLSNKIMQPVTGNSFIPSTSL